MPQRPIAEDLIRQTAAGPRLLGGRRCSDGKVVFPLPQGAEGAQYEAMELADEGTLWSFTVQRFRPKSPPYAGADTDQSFKPFALGYVELAGQVIVESRLKVEDFADLKVGMPMRMTQVAFPTVSDPDTFTYAFEPA
ncbi:MAG: hypothetical protein JWP35_2916 [Caulobacter sp.]|nr:hypothetical protein [Caulobacter sp.]